jgi:hypothetical protein
MGFTKITDLPEASTPIPGGEKVEAVQAGASVQLALGTVVEADLDDLLESADFPSDTAWTTTTTLLNGWTGTVRYIKRAGMVTVVVDSSDATSATATTLISLPAGYRPLENIRGVAVALGPNPDQVGLFSVLTGGGLQISSDAGNEVLVYGTVTYPVIT